MPLTQENWACLRSIPPRAQGTFRESYRFRSQDPGVRRRPGPGVPGRCCAAGPGMRVTGLNRGLRQRLVSGVRRGRCMIGGRSSRTRRSPSRAAPHAVNHWRERSAAQLRRVRLASWPARASALWAGYGPSPVCRLCRPPTWSRRRPVKETVQSVPHALGRQVAAKYAASTS